MGEYFESIWDENNHLVKHIRVREDVSEIIDELSRSVQHIVDKISLYKTKYEDAVSNAYKDEELNRLRKELHELQAERYYGFEISEEEHDKIVEWQNDWFRRKNNGSSYLGAAGGGFTYKFEPTGIGTIGVVMAPDGEEFEFRSL